MSREFLSHPVGCLGLVLVCLSPCPAAGAWPSDPVVNLPICTAASNQQHPAIASDGAGGAFVTWDDFRNEPYYDIYAQHVLANGTLDPTWPNEGLLVCASASNQQNPAIASDGAGGAFVTWEDLRNEPYLDIYAQHVLANGTLDPAWPTAGRAVCAAPLDQQQPAIAIDGAGGAIVTWEDFRNEPEYDIYAQHLLANGTVDAAWPTGGRAVCTAAEYQQQPAITSDGSGGAIVAWDDFRGAPEHDIYAQHVLANGALDAAWLTDGRSVCTAAWDQQWPAIASDGAGGALVTWQDFRGASPYDIYAQRVRANGQLGDDPTIAVIVPWTPTFSLENVRPNPAHGELRVALSLASSEPAVVELVDPSGRILARRDVSATPGRHLVNLRGGAAIRPGIYFVRLVQGAQSLSLKACVTR